MKNRVLFPVTSLVLLGACGHNTPSPEEYNVIYILADDLGYGDVGCYGQQKIRTPNIDRLAAEGVRFTQHYAGCTVSAPSRSSLMTGQHTGHTPIRGNKSRGEGLEGQYPIPDETYTLAEMFHQAGYVTGAFGKWGLGYPRSEGDPVYQGFDEFFGVNCQVMAHRYYPEYLWHNLEKYPLEGNDKTNCAQYSQDVIHERALRFIADNKDRKFFAFLPYTLPHAEILVPEDSIVRSYRGRLEENKPFRASKGSEYGPDMVYMKYCPQPEPHAQFAAMVSRLDKYVGDVLTLVDSLGLGEKTIVVFASDNGPHREGGADPDYFGSYGPLRGIKRDMYEGGVRVPMIARCPGLIPSGTVSDHVCAFWDVLPTFAEMADVEPASQIDGISFWPALTGRGGQKEHEYLYWEFHEMGGKIAVRMGKWKGIKLHVLKDPRAKIELYDLETDLHEDHNVADVHPEIVERIEAIMREARTPSPVFRFEQPSGEI